ncbi:MAG TPA: SAM-dependent methyltransferase, partial [Flavobacteriales bacterium]|nr:SAM-dependent methyltransferase [Flavobacteriales bacterium]
IKQKYVCWNHGLAEVVTSLLNKGMTLKLLREFDYSPYAFVNHSEEVESGKFRIKNFQDKVPLVYALEAIKS